MSVVKRYRLLQAMMTWLALLAVVLLLVAPLLSRALLTPPPSTQAVCTSDGLRSRPMPAMPSVGDEAAHHHPPALIGTINNAIDGPHHGHADSPFACDYCVLAAGLLPWLALSLLLWLYLPRRSVRSLTLDFSPRRLVWPAHAARGPPL